MVKWSDSIWSPQAFKSNISCRRTNINNNIDTPHFIWVSKDHQQNRATNDLWPREYLLYVGKLLSP